MSDFCSCVVSNEVWEEDRRKQWWHRPWSAWVKLRPIVFVPATSLLCHQDLKILLRNFST
jgi:hypothetical protein